MNRAEPRRVDRRWPARPELLGGPRLEAPSLWERLQKGNDLALEGEYEQPADITCVKEKERALTELL